MEILSVAVSLDAQVIHDRMLGQGRQPGLELLFGETRQIREGQLRFERLELGARDALERGLRRLGPADDEHVPCVGLQLGGHQHRAGDVRFGHDAG